MTGLLRTSLFFFLPIFLILAAYQTLVSNQPSAEEQRQIFRERNEPTLSLVRSEVETLLAEEKTGKLEMPDALYKKGVILAEVHNEVGPILSLLSAALMNSKTWSFAPDPAPSASYAATHQFLITPSNDGTPVRVVLFEETVYQASGDPVRLNIYLQRNSVAGDE